LVAVAVGFTTVDQVCLELLVVVLPQLTVHPFQVELQHQAHLAVLKLLL
jgi:hypothetical protein